MSKLMDAAEKLSVKISSTRPTLDREEIEITYRFIEVLTFSSKEEILEMLGHYLGRDFLGLPVWVRNLAYRLACLQDPDDKKTKVSAGYDLLSFGPDWDDEANRLINEGKS